jgi:predicted pyridoxine 5'-phosphate oxidase superfamily flavin-nucleotide-binding protein
MDVLGSPAASPLTQEMKDMIARLRLCYVATVSPDGSPNVSPRGSLKVVDGHRLAWADILSPNTMRNLAVNPRVEVVLVDPLLRRGFRFRGTAQASSDEAIVRLVATGLGAEFPVRGAVVLQVHKALPVRSPVYAFTQQTEEEIVRQWRTHYGWPAA